MNIHSLKTTPPHFNNLIKGDKTFEIRKNDRDFQVGDKLILLEYDPCLPLGANPEFEKELPEPFQTKIVGYTGKGYTALVQHILRHDEGDFGLKEGYVIMSLEPGHEIKI